MGVWQGRHEGLKLQKSSILTLYTKCNITTYDTYAFNIHDTELTTLGMGMEFLDVKRPNVQDFSTSTHININLINVYTYMLAVGTG